MHCDTVQHYATYHCRKHTVLQQQCVLAVLPTLRNRTALTPFDNNLLLLHNTELLY
jgi:hypothetical protein